MWTWKSFQAKNLQTEKGIEGEILSQVLEQVGIEVIRNFNLSERLCKPCANLRRTCEGPCSLMLTLWFNGRKEGGVPKKISYLK